jgi:Mg-chelatase subunit ChlD
MIDDDPDDDDVEGDELAGAAALDDDVDPAAAGSTVAAPTPSGRSPEEERLRRWRLVLGSAAEEQGLGGKGTRGSGEFGLTGDDLSMDRSLEALYDSDRRGGLGGSNPSVSRWLGDIRKYFPQSAVTIMQRDALDRLKLNQMLTQPELLRTIEPDVHLAATLISMKHLLPAKTRDTARQVVRKVADDLEARLRNKLLTEVGRALRRAGRSRRPRFKDIDWHRTIRANLGTWRAESKSIIPEKLIGFGRSRSGMQDLILAIDQSGSMAASAVYASVFGAVLGSLPALRTRMVTFDTEIADLTDMLHDPVEILFAGQLGGGTDINRALTYCEGLVTRPTRTTLVLISDLFEGGDSEGMIARSASMVRAGVRMIALLALSDEGKPSHDPGAAGRLAELGVPSFGCTPDLFPEMMAAAISGDDLNQWAAKRGIVTSPANASGIEGV